VALFGTSGAGDGIEVKAVEELLKPVGAVMEGRCYCQGRIMYFGQRGHPSEEELAKAREFASEMKKHAEQGKG